MSSPSSVTRPRVGFSRPVTTLNRVVFPAPLGPIRPVMCPPSAARDTSSTATRPPNRTVTPVSSRRAIGPASCDRYRLLRQRGEIQHAVHAGDVLGPVGRRDPQPLQRDGRRPLLHLLARLRPGPG